MRLTRCLHVTTLVVGLLLGHTHSFTNPTSSRQSIHVTSVPHTTATNQLYIPVSSSQLNESSGLNDIVTVEADYDALVKYHAAVAIQMTLICGIFKGLDLIVEYTQIADSIPTLALFPLFFGLSLKSRSLNPLDNRRPDIKKAILSGDAMGETDAEEEGNTPPAASRGFGDRVMPTWTPPGIVFPIMWVLIIGPLRAYSSALIYQANGHHFLDPALLALMFHLCIGDVWNTMNNSEQRFGASVTGVLCVTASALNAAYQYYTVDETAGNLLGLPMVWFAVAASLITATWKLNPVDVETGELDVLYPVVREDKTEFAWFN
eukprot:CAMPEP_0194442850 /NCGR_PEP_ID=MMETSP0176-20130528/126365_1 /TAXON_ID=216777 /ORGANISM="Proboscia alata, Strain PI-D3" /LENGTH=318 /DNA_ID=CAMNT_0039269007 /DNA_START=489 /DNA_END=1445 /DNA_ORIENTATION=-